MLKRPTWILSDSCYNISTCAGMVWRRPCVTLDGFVTYPLHKFRQTSSLSYFGYVIFPSLRCTIYYLQNMSVYDVFPSVYSLTVSTLDSIPSLFDPILTIFPTPYSRAASTVILNISFILHVLSTIYCIWVLRVYCAWEFWNCPCSDIEIEPIIFSFVLPTFTNF